MRSVKEGKASLFHSDMSLVNVQNAATFDSEATSAICASAPLILRTASSMVSRRGPSQAAEYDELVKERLAKERARLQAIAKRKSEKNAENKPHQIVGGSGCRSQAGGEGCRKVSYT